MDHRSVLYTTRAMRRLRPDPVPESILARIVDAGVRAPSPGAQQPWRFVVITDPEVMRQLALQWRSARDAVLAAIPDLYPSARQAASSQYLYDHFDELPALVLGYGPDNGPPTVTLALWSMCLAARGEGVGSVFTTLLTRVEPEVNRIVGVPDDAGVRLQGAVPMGYPIGTWGIAPRASGHEVAFHNRWGQTPSWEEDPPPSVGD